MSKLLCRCYGPASAGIRYNAKHLEKLKKDFAHNEYRNQYHLRLSCARKDNKINLFCGDKANRRADPAAEYRRKQGASGLEDLRPETESGIGDLHQLVEIRAFPGANRHPLQNAVKKLRQLRDIAARGQFALRLPLLQKLG